MTFARPLLVLLAGAGSYVLCPTSYVPCPTSYVLGPTACVVGSETADVGRGTSSDWWHKDWAYRRPVRVLEKTEWSAPDGVALVELPTLGKARPDGADFRVIGGDGRERPIQVLSSGFHDMALLAFAGRPGERVDIYFGNPDAVASSHSTLFRFGLMLETRDRGPGMPRDWAAMERILQDSPKVQGRWRRPGLSLGFNPLGGWSNGIYLFEGYLRCPKPGIYSFGINSIDGAFLLVDDKVVAAWPGWHGAWGHAYQRHRGSIRLSAGIHRIRFVNAFRWHGACVVGWQPPGETRIRPVPPTAFVGAYRTEVEAVQTRRESLPDFTWRAVEDLGMWGRPVTAVRFTRLSGGDDAAWDFGDGVTAEGRRSPLHVFLEIGSFTVTLRSRGTVVRQRVDVRPVMPYRAPWGRQLRLFARRLSVYPVEKLSPSAAYQLALLAHEDARFDLAVRGFRTAVEKGLPLGAEETRWVLRLLELYRERGRHDDALRTADRLAEKGPPGEGLVAKGFILLEDLRRIAEAEACFTRVLANRKKTPKPLVRRALIGMGMAALARGDRESARRHLKEAESTGGREIDEGAYLIAFEEYLQKGEFSAAEEQIEKWVAKQPTELLSGMPDHLRGRVRLAQKKYADALRDFERALATNPGASFGDEALLWMGEAHAALGRDAKAKECWKALIDRYPESTLVERARKMMGEAK